MYNNLFISFLVKYSHNCLFNLYSQTVNFVHFQFIFISNNCILRPLYDIIIFRFLMPNKHLGAMMRRTKTQKEYQKQIKKHHQESGNAYKKPKFNIFRNAFTQSKFFYYLIRIILVLVVISLVNNIDALIYSLFK